MTEPMIAQKMPYAVEEQPGNNRRCARGHSKQQPYRDGCRPNLPRSEPSPSHLKCEELLKQLNELNA